MVEEEEEMRDLLKIQGKDLSNKINWIIVSILK